MTAIPASIESHQPGPGSEARQGPATIGARQRRAITQIGVIGVALVLIALAVWQLPRDVGTARQPEAAIHAVMPAQAVDGVLTMVIPAGAAAEQQQGGPGYEMPSVISLAVGDTIVIRNDDNAPHMILYTFLKPGETDKRTFTAPGSETYSSGCGLHAASYHSFTTIFVTAQEPASTGSAA
ncbi:MAG: hypothetical protein U0031_20615 [Thermomicrobiales bacterium]